MKTKNLKTFCLILILVVFTISSGCNKNGDYDGLSGLHGDNTAAKGKNMLKVYAYISGERISTIDYAIDKIKKQMPEVEIEVEEAVSDNEEKLRTYAATGNLPDIYEMSVSIIPGLVKSENIMALDGYIKELELREKIKPSNLRLLDLLSFEGKVYGFPKSGQSLALIYYNKEIFSENRVKIPENYNEFLEAVRSFSSKGIIPLALFGGQMFMGIQFFDMIVTRMEPKGILRLNEPDGRVSEPAFANAAIKVQELVNAGLLAKGFFSTTHDEAISLFTEGKAAMFANGTWEIKELSLVMGDKVDILYYPLADAENSEASKWFMSGGGDSGAFAACPHSRYKDTAGKLACLIPFYMAEAEYVLYQTTDVLMKNPLESGEEYTPLAQRFLNDSLNFKSVSGFSWTLANQQVKTLLEEKVALLLTGEYSYNDFIKDVDRELDIIHSN